MALLNDGEKFPTASLQDIDGKPIDFPSILTEAPASIVFFYRGQWWPWCRAQVAAFIYELERFQENNVQILGIRISCG